MRTIWGMTIRISDLRIEDVQVWMGMKRTRKLWTSHMYKLRSTKAPSAYECCAFTADPHDLPRSHRTLSMSPAARYSGTRGTKILLSSPSHRLA